MPRGDGIGLPVGVAEERRLKTDRRRRAHVEIARFLGASQSARPGFLELRAVGVEEHPVQVTLPVEAAMTLLNDLQRLANEDRWFQD